MAFIAAKKGEVAEGEGVGEGGVVGAGVGAMEANTWCTRSHDGHWGWVGAVGVAQAWQWEEGGGEGSGPQPGASGGGGEEAGGVSGCRGWKESVRGGWMETLEAWPHGGRSGPKKRNLGTGEQAGGQPWAWAFNLRIGGFRRDLQSPPVPSFSKRENKAGRG